MEKKFVKILNNPYREQLNGKIFEIASTFWHGVEIFGSELNKQLPAEFHFDDEFPYAFSRDRLVFVEAPAKATKKFKVGDKVKLVADFSFMPEFKLSTPYERGLIFELSGKTLKVDHSDAKYIVQQESVQGFSVPNCPIYLPTSLFELIEQTKPIEPISDKPDLKVGDRIRVTNPQLTCGLYKLDDVLTITKIRKTGVEALNSEKASCSLWNSEFEKVAPKKYSGMALALADRMALEILAEIYKTDVSVVFYVNKEAKTVKATTRFGVPFKESEAIARCSSNDEFFPEIGKLVALCKMTHKPIPQWILGE